MQDARVDAYIAKAGAFAQPVLMRVREIVHIACPEVEETMKWSRPFFVYRGVILANMSAFKEHCAIGLWGPEIKAILAKDGLVSDGAMGTFGRIQSVKDLPSDKAMAGYFRQAAGFVASGERTQSLAPMRKAAKSDVLVPVELAAALKKNKVAAKVFAGFSPSCQREYTEWVAEAKRVETKTKRVAQAVEWMEEGKSKNWKYESC